VLSQLNDIDGVDGSFVNESGSMVGVNLKPGADRDRVVREAQTILREKVSESDRLPPGEESPPLSGGAAEDKFQSEQWTDSNHVAQRAVEQRRAEARRIWIWLLALMVTLSAGIWFTWRHRQRLAVLASANS
jgi:hypothetical protein